MNVASHDTRIIQKTCLLSSSTRHEAERQRLFSVDASLEVPGEANIRAPNGAGPALPSLDCGGCTVQTSTTVHVPSTAMSLRLAARLALPCPSLVRTLVNRAAQRPIPPPRGTPAAVSQNFFL